MHFCYILYTPSADRFYTGSTSLLPDERLERHLKKYYGKMKFTSRYSDWELFHFIECKSKKQAMAIERHIKKMKSKTYIRNLKKYTEINEKLLMRFDS